MAEAPEGTSGPVSGRGILLVTATFVLLAAFMTWPQALVLNSHAADHQDVFFNLWRIRWVAHALWASPADLFNANIFHPEPGVLAYSDAMLVQGLVAAPLLWASVPPVLVHNLLLLGAIVASAVGIFVLARHLTGSAAGGMIAGVIFAFAPYRFEHYMHMELQWTVWSPWAFWALQRTIETGSWRFGLLMGVFLALQVTSCIYYGVFILILLPIVAVLQVITLPRRALLRASRALLLGGALAVSISWIYSLPYSAAADRVGTRSVHEVDTYSARPSDYRVATPTNLLYGSDDAGRAERRLFTGILPALLALASLVLRRPTAAVIAYLLGLIVSLELSLGTNGYLHPLLYEHVSVMRGLRAPARASVFVLMFLGILAARGTAVLSSAVARPAAAALPALACAVVLLEYRVGPLALVPYPNDAPPLYRVLARLPPGIVIEFPTPKPGTPPYHDPRFTYLSTFHWKPLLNGYSGFYPPSYLRRLVRLADFPDEASVASLRRENVTYVIVHEDGYRAGEYAQVLEHLLRLGLTPVAEGPDGWGAGTLMKLK